MPRLVCFALLALCCGNALAEVPGQTALQSGQYARARAEVAAALAEHTSTTLRLMPARISLAENKLDDAQTAVEEVLDDAPDSAAAHALKGRILAIRASRSGVFRTGQYAREALSAYDAALSVDPEHIEALTGIIRFRNSAPRLFGGSFKLALREAATLSRIDPVLGALETASIYRARNEDKQESDILRRLARTHPSDPRAFLQLGFGQQRQSAWTSANDYFTKALLAAAQRPDHSVTAQSARYQIGRTAVLSGLNTEQGIRALTDYLDGPQFGELPAVEWAHYRRGLLYERAGDNDRARGDFSRAAATTTDRDLKRALDRR